MDIPPSSKELNKKQLLFRIKTNPEKKRMASGCPNERHVYAEREPCMCTR